MNCNKISLIFGKLLSFTGSGSLVRFYSDHFEVIILNVLVLNLFRRTATILEFYFQRNGPFLFDNFLSIITVYVIFD